MQVLPKYPSYKDSGVPWLGEIPNQWKVKRLKWITRLTYGDSLPSEVRRSGTVPVFGSNGIVGTHDAANTESDTIIIGRKGSFGQIQYSEKSAFVIDTAYYVDKRNTRSDLRWLYYVLTSLNLDSFTKDSAIPGLAREEAYTRLVPVCPIEDQHRIAAFLDQKTAEIDEAISKKQRLIELLKEQKAILINQAVTKGPNPNVPMRDSGVEWIGAIPAHWDIPPMYARYRIELGKMLDAKRITGRHLVEYLRNTDVQWGTINTNDLPQMDINPTERERYTVKNGDLLVCEGGDIGRCAIWEGINSEIGYQKALHRVRAFDRKKENIAYLFYVMRAASHSWVFFETAKPNTISHLTGKMFKRYRFPQPPKEEQEEIVRHLRDRECTYHEIVVRELAGIDRLSELKSILISQAVTGKIKV